MKIALQGMMVYLISCPDQVKNKILASFAPSWFVFCFFFRTARCAQDLSAGLKLKASLAKRIPLDAKNL